MMLVFPVAGSPRTRTFTVTVGGCGGIPAPSPTLTGSIFCDSLSFSPFIFIKFQQHTAVALSQPTLVKKNIYPLRNKQKSDGLNSNPCAGKLLNASAKANTIKRLHTLLITDLSRSFFQRLVSSYV